MVLSRAKVRDRKYKKARLAWELIQARRVVTQWRLDFRHDLTDDEQDALEDRIIEALCETVETSR